MSSLNNSSCRCDELEAELLQVVSFDAYIHTWCLVVIDELEVACLGLFLANADGATVRSKVTTGVASAVRIKLSIGPKSLAGFVALTKRQLNNTDVNDARALQSMHPELRFADAVDKSTEFRSVEMINPTLFWRAMPCWAF